MTDGGLQIMPYSKAPKDHTEFGGGPGLIDPMQRADRIVEPWEAAMEMRASNPLDPTTPIQETDLTAVPMPKPYEWPDKKTAKGTVEP